MSPGQTDSPLLYSVSEFAAHCLHDFFDVKIKRPALRQVYYFKNHLGYIVIIRVVG